ncbi:unnamed protein product [Protopolystoma xenopodis]|uniref:F5/8 type C domain-containing protein n=1 Tax=Protopolystoma xenopodis TaxID=117903 RepID=A0A3S5CMZ2_9PLAT|nr:unnamed protein product [Protopolystoma xenopodis]
MEKELISFLFRGFLIFEGNTDSFTVKHNYFDQAISARFIKLHTYTWNNHPSLRVELVGCQPCKQLIGIPPYARFASSSSKGQRAQRSCTPEYGHYLSNKGWCAKRQDSESTRCSAVQTRLSGAFAASTPEICCSDLFIGRLPFFPRFPSPLRFFCSIYIFLLFLWNLSTCRIFHFISAKQWLQIDLGPPTQVNGVIIKGRGDGKRPQYVTRFKMSYSNDSRLWYLYKDAAPLDPRVSHVRCHNKTES